MATYRVSQAASLPSSSPRAAVPRPVLGKIAPAAPYLRRSPIAKAFDPDRRPPTREELKGLTREQLLERLEEERALHRAVLNRGFFKVACAYVLLMLMLAFGSQIRSFVITALTRIWSGA